MKMFLKELLVITAVFAVILGAAVFLEKNYGSGLNPVGGSSAYVSLGPKADAEVGHCTGVHIGEGKFITAAHCVPSNTNVKQWVEVTTSVGPKGTFLEEKFKVKTHTQIYWVNRDYDVALLQLPFWESIDDYDFSTLSCRTPPVGTNLEAVGNPLDLRNFHSYGKVATEARRVAHWKEVVVGNIAAGPGISGGPVYNSAGKVDGIIVGGFSPFANVSIIVPSSVICNLMGK